MVGLSSPVQCKCQRASWVGGRAGERVAGTGLGLVLLITMPMTDDRQHRLD